MLTRRHMYSAHRWKCEGKLFRHCRNSANILSRISRLLDQQPLLYRLDSTWPSHLIVYVNERVLSVYSGGFNKTIEIVPLKLDGHPYSSKTEKSFLTPKGAVNYILRKYGKKRNESMKLGMGKV